MVLEKVGTTFAGLTCWCPCAREFYLNRRQIVANSVANKNDIIPFSPVSVNIYISVHASIQHVWPCINQVYCRCHDSVELYDLGVCRCKRKCWAAVTQTRMVIRRIAVEENAITYRLCSFNSCFPSSLWQKYGVFPEYHRSFDISHQCEFPWFCPDSSHILNDP